MSEATPSGAIHDIGYRRYDGPRLGASYIRRSLFLETLRGSFGLGRSARSKVMPNLMFGVLVLLAVVLGLVTGYFGMNELPMGYEEFVFSMQVPITIFLASQAPVAVSRDLRFRIAPLYFSRPLSRQQYVQARYGGMTAAMCVLTAVPLTLLLRVGQVRVADLQYPQIGGDGFSIEKLAEPTQRQEQVDAGIVQLVEFATMLTPLRAGPLTIGPASMRLNVIQRERRQDRFFGFFGDFGIAIACSSTAARAASQPSRTRCARPPSNTRQNSSPP